MTMPGGNVINALIALFCRNHAQIIFFTLKISAVVTLAHDSEENDFFKVDQWLLPPAPSRELTPV